MNKKPRGKKAHRPADASSRQRELPPSRSPHHRDEARYFGINAVKALCSHRMAEVVRILLREDLVSEFRSELKKLAELRRPYRVVSDRDLEKVSGSNHHEGICAVAPECSELPFDTLIAELQRDSRPRMIPVLEGVSNPHNIGAMLRSAAHFGVTEMVFLPGAECSFSGSLARVAEGGVEVVRKVVLDRGPASLKQFLQLGFVPLATTPHTRVSLFKGALPKRTLFLIGSEGAGLSAGIRKMAQRELAIPGSGAVESLNVSTASALCFAEFYRQYQC